MNTQIEPCQTIPKLPSRFDLYPGLHFQTGLWRLLIHPFLLRKKLEKRALLVSEEKEDYTKETDDLLRAFELYKSAGKEQVMAAGFQQRVGKLEASKLAQKNLRTWNSCLMALCVYLLKAS